MKLLTVVGEGAFGKVFLAKIASTNKYYGVKMLQKHRLIERQVDLDYAKFEINVMKDMKHPNILGIDFVRQEDYYIYLILPFSDGGDLRECFKEKVRANEKKKFKGVDLTEEQILFWALKIIKAVGYLHSKKIVHRDLKMANILIDTHSDLKVCDFGLAYQFKTDSETQN